MKNFLLVLIFVLISGFVVQGQNIHFTQFKYSPISYNPANTGAFYGTIRASGIYRSQWQGLYNTYTFSADSPVVTGFRKQDWVGVGLMVLKDVAGTGNLTNNLMKISVSYHLGLDKKMKNVLTLGFRAGTENRGFKSADKLIYGDDAETYQKLLTTSNKGNDKPGKITDLALGLLLTSNINEKTKIHAGVSVGYLGTPSFDLDSVKVNHDTMPMLINIHADAAIKLTDKWTALPAIYHQRVNTLSETVLHARAGYRLFDDKDFTLTGGLGYRLGDAIQFLGGIEYNSLSVGLAYDVTTSKVRSAAHEGFEIGASYIYTFVKQPKLDKIKTCPRLY